MGVECEPALPRSELYEVRRGDVGAARWSRWLQAARSVPLVATLRRSLVRRRVQLVHTNTLKMAAIGGLAARVSGVPIVWHMRDILPAGPARQALHEAARAARPTVIAISKAVAQTLDGLDLRVEVVHNGIDPAKAVPRRSRAEVRRDLGLPASAPVAVALGRLTPWKRHADLLRALARPAEPLPRTHLLVVGDSAFWEEDHAAELRALAAELGLADRAHFIGFRDDVYDVLAASDVLALPSEHEPFGRALIEAMAVGTPVIATRSGGVPEIVEHERCGLLVEVGDVEALAAAVARVLTDAGLRRSLAEEGQRRAHEVFTLDRTVAGITSVYESLLAQQTPAVT
jgi:glycosyltransferase involved in cell wall biosynthesis